MCVPGGYEHSAAGERSSVDYLPQADTAAFPGRRDEGGPALKREHEIDEILPVSAKTDAGTKALWQRLMAVAE